MASLTVVAYQTRKGINWAILIFICYLILRLLWSMLVAFWIYMFPAKPPPPNHAFGKLPHLSFPAPPANAPQLTFSLETISGGFPNASDSARVYFMPKASPNLLAISRTQEFAKKLNFSTTPNQESRTVYRFDDPQTTVRKLRYDIVSNNFILKYQYAQDTSVFGEAKPKDPNILARDAANYLEGLQLLTQDFLAGFKQTTLLTLVGNTLQPVTNLSQADAIRLDFFRAPIGGFKLMTPRPDEGAIEMIITGASKPERKFIELTYTYWPIDGQTFATYKLKPMQKAWEELQNGQGYVARYPNNNETKAVVRTVYIAYYDNFDPQNFLQPIYVFEGDHGVVAYVPAVDAEWTE